MHQHARSSNSSDRLPKILKPGTGSSGILVVAESLGVRRVLRSSVLDDAHPIARAGTQFLRAYRAWEGIVGALFLVAVPWAALHDRLMAAILSVTGLLVVVLSVVGRRWLRPQ